MVLVVLLLLAALISTVSFLFSLVNPNKSADDRIASLIMDGLAIGTCIAAAIVLL